jgi:gliding motility-associated-like protein
MDANYHLNNPSIANPVASPVQSTTYYVSVKENNCITTDSVVIHVSPKPLFTITPEVSNICLGDSVLLSVSGGDQYKWSPTTTTSNPTSASSIVFPSTDTHYEVFVTDNKCKVSGIVNAIVNILPALQIHTTKSNDVNCNLGQAILSATGGTSYQWFPVENLSSPTLSSTIASPAATTMYYVKATGINGCITRDSIELIVQKNPIGSNYLIPTAFTPNNDGVNDCFGITKWGYTTNLEFAIFNRWGERVFFTNNPSSCWDGLYKGKPQPIGVYVYIIKAKGICGDINRKGIIELIR